MIGFKVFGGRAKKRPASVLTSGGSGSTPATDPVDQRGENSGLETEKVSETTK